MDERGAESIMNDNNRAVESKSTEPCVFIYDGYTELLLRQGI